MMTRMLVVCVVIACHLWDSMRPLLFVVLDCSKLPQSNSIFYLPIGFLWREPFWTARELLRTVLGRQIKVTNV